MGANVRPPQRLLSLERCPPRWRAPATTSVASLLLLDAGSWQGRRTGSIRRRWSEKGQLSGSCLPPYRRWQQRHQANAKNWHPDTSSRRPLRHYSATSSANGRAPHGVHTKERIRNASFVRTKVGPRQRILSQKGRARVAPLQPRNPTRTRLSSPLATNRVRRKGPIRRRHFKKS